MSSSENKKPNRISKIPIIIVCIIGILCAERMYQERSMQQTFDSVLEKMNSRSEDWEPYNRVTDPTAEIYGWSKVGEVNDEKAILYDYLKALSYDHPYYSGRESQDALEWQHYYMDYCIPPLYSGYYSGEIAKYREKINKRYKRLREVQKFYEGRNCTKFGCKYSCAIEVIADGRINGYDYCWTHKCSENGCGAARTTEDYCTEHTPNKRICAFENCTELAYYADGDYCYEHTCKYHSCRNMVCRVNRVMQEACKDHWKLYNEEQMQKRIKEAEKSREAEKKNKKSAGGKSSGSSYYKSYKSGSSGGSKLDPFDVHDFDDPDDFADEWAEDFGDGNFDDGWDDAWDYWQENQ